MYLLLTVLLVWVLCFLSITTLFFAAFAALSLRLNEREEQGIDVLPRNRFAVLIPAHNEEKTLTTCIESLRKQKYPLSLIEAVVIADNCTDQTVEVACQLGVTCLERQDPHLRGKGHALNWALQRLPLDNYDAVVMIDADAVFDEKYFLVMNQHLEKGSLVIQSVNGVLNPDESWLTKTYDIVKNLRVKTYYKPASIINRSCQLFGLGMCFHISVVKRFSWPTFSIAEDLEFYALLVEHGILPTFTDKAIVRSAMQRTLKDSYGQRLRWSSGKFQIIRKYGFKLLWNGLKDINWPKVGAGINILFPSYSLTVNLITASFILNFFIIQNEFFYYWISLLVVLFFTHLAIGCYLLKLPIRNYRLILLSPVFIGWKVIIDTLGFLGYRSEQWIKTKR